MAARIRIPLREHRPNHLAMQRTLMNNYYYGILPFSLQLFRLRRYAATPAVMLSVEELLPLL